MKNDVPAKPKGLSRFDVLNLVIGWGSFILQGSSFLPNSGVVNTALGLCIGGIFVLAIQKAYQVMLASHIGEGGPACFSCKENL